MTPPSFIQQLINALCQQVDDERPSKIDLCSTNPEEQVLLLLINGLLTQLTQLQYTSETEAQALRNTRALAINSALRFEQATHKARVLTWECDIAGQLTYISPNVNDILGLRPHILLDRLKATDLLGTSVGTDLWRELTELGLRDIEEQLDIEGKSIWLSTSALPILDEDDQLLGFRGASLDIAERKESELRQKLSLQLARNLRHELTLYEFHQVALDTLHPHTGSSLSFLVSSEENWITAISGEVDALYDENGEYACVLTCHLDTPTTEWIKNDSIVPLAGCPQTNCFLNAFQSVLSIDLTAYDHHHGLWILVDKKANAFDLKTKDRLKELGQELSFALHQKRAKSALLESEYQLKSIMDNVSDLIWHTDLEGHLHFASHAVHGLLSEQAERHLQHIRLLPEVGALIDEQVNQQPQERKPHVFEAELTSPQGHLLTLEVSAILIRDAIGDNSLLYIGRDITSRKQKAFEDLQNLKLESVGRLAAGIAHEINTPIQYVNDSIYFLNEAFGDLNELMGNYDELLESCDKEGEIAEEIAELKEEIELDFLNEEIPKAVLRSQNGLNKVAEIVRAMKDFARPIKTERRAMNLIPTIESTLVVAKNEYKYVSDLKLDLQPIPKVNAHAGEIGQVFLNLLINAAEAIEAVVGKSGEKGQIAIRTSFESPWVTVEISDTGEGIPPEKAPIIFDPFYTSKGVQGKGQGLAIAKSIILSHQGKLEFNSRPNEGTTFWVRLPALLE